MFEVNTKIKKNKKVLTLNLTYVILSLSSEEKLDSVIFDNLKHYLKDSHERM